MIVRVAQEGIMSNIRSGWWKSLSSNKKEYEELIQCRDVTNRTSRNLRSSVFKDGAVAGEMRVEMLLHLESSPFPVFNTHRRC